jgi:hypothetical protein
VLRSIERVIIVTWNRRERSGEFSCVIRVDLVGKPVTSRVIEVRICSVFVSPGNICVSEAL